MFNGILNHYHIRFQKQSRFKVLSLLPMLLLLEKLWLLKKRILGINRPIVHLYALCWNEAKILPFVLRYYEEFVDHFYIYDNFSDDDTDVILINNSKVTVRKFDTDGQFNDLVHQKIKNTVWKKSRGKADWVIVIDMDELIYHPCINEFLNKTEYSIFKPKGFNMVSSDFPKIDFKITDQIKVGIPDDKYAKMVLFNPHRIVDINYEPGAHEAYPIGIVSVVESKDFKLLHYKNLGPDYVIGRIMEYNKRMSEINKEMGLGFHYEKQKSQIIDEINIALKSAISVID